MLAAPLVSIAKNKGQDNDAGHAGCYVLCDLEALFVRQLRDLGVVGLNFGRDHCAVAVLIVRLDDSDRLSISTRARACDAVRKAIQTLQVFLSPVRVIACASPRTIV